MKTVAIVACSNGQKEEYRSQNEELARYLEKTGHKVLWSNDIYEKNAAFSGTGAERAAELKKIFPERFNFVRANFSEICKLQTDKGYAGILFDFGVSSFQLDEASRGFSFLREGPLDMRMDSSEGQTALDLINSLSEIELAKIFREYAEIPNFSKLARAVKAAADAGKISTTRDLAESVEKVSPSTPRGKIHPATLVFQALRIAVNDELGEIERALPEAFELLEIARIDQFIVVPVCNPH